jgi:hypothetical protein
MKTRNWISAAVGAATLLAASQAGAVSVVDAKTIRIENALDTYLQVSEVVALEFGTLVNVAASANGGSASASSIYPGGFEPSLAINEGPGMFHSEAGVGEFLEITFSGVFDLTSLTIFGRGVESCCAARDLFEVTIFNASGATLFFGELDARSTGSATINFDDPPPTGAIPEPSTWAMMILGFGAAGAAVRSRRRAVSLS